jgi:hypothetical protein
MRKVVLAAVLVVVAARHAGAFCITEAWFAVPASRILPARGSLYVQETSAEGLAGAFTWTGGTGSIAYVELGDRVVRVDYDAGSATALEVRLSAEVTRLDIGNPPRETTPPVVIGSEHSGYDGDFVCAHSSSADITIDRPVAAFHAVWTMPCSSGRCVFADKVVASRTIRGRGQIQFGNLGCGTDVMPASFTLDGPPLPDNLELALTAIEFDGRETSVRGAPSWSAVLRVLSSPLPSFPPRDTIASGSSTPWLLVELAGLLAACIALVAMAARAARTVDD